MLPRALPLLLVVVAPLLGAPGGCGGGAEVMDRLEAPPAVVSEKETVSELHFKVHALTTEAGAFKRAEVRVNAESNVQARGQVRITLASGTDLGNDAGRAQDTLPITVGASTTVPRAAFENCELADGASCDDAFTVVVSAEGLPDGLRLEVPLVLEAQLFYEDGAASDGDSVRLELVPPSSETTDP